MRTQTLAAALAGGVLLVGGGLWTGVSWYAGSRLANAFTALPQHMATHALDVQALEFNRGLFSSTAQTAWRWPWSQDEAAPLWLHFDHTIAHRLSLGGTLGRMHSRLVVDENTQKALGLSPRQTPLEVNSLLTWDGAQRHDLVAIPLSGDHEGWRFTWEGAKGHVRISDEQRRFQAQIHAPALTLESPTHALAVSWTGLHLNAQQASPRPYGFWTGESMLDVAQFSLGHPKAPHPFVHVETAQARITSQLEGRLLSSEAKVSAHHVQFMEHKGEAAQLLLRLEGLSASAVDAFLADLHALDEGNEAQATRVLWEHLPALLASKPELRIDPFAVRFDSGDVMAQLRLRYTGEDRLFSLRFFENLEGQFGAQLPEALLMGYLTDHARNDVLTQLRRLRIDKSSAEVDALAREEAALFRERLISSGLFVEENGQWSLDLALNGGHVLAHGRTLAPLLLHLLKGVF